MRSYTVEGNQEVDGSGGDVTETQLTLTNPADQTARIRRIRIGQTTHTTAELYLAELQRTSTPGTGGSTPTPSLKDLGDSIAGVAVRAGPTVEPTYTANTLLMSRVWNAVLGMEQVWAQGEGPILPGQGIAGLKITALNGTTAFTPDVEIEWDEEG